MKLEVVGIGHPRTGTKFTSELLTSWGLQVGHECPLRDGIVAWELIKKNDPWAFNWLSKQLRSTVCPEYNYLIYNIRDPISSIPSIVYTEDTNKKSLEFRKSFFSLPVTKNPVEMAINSIIQYDTHARLLQPDVTYRIENDTKLLFDRLSDNYAGLKYNTINKKNVREHNSAETLKLQFNQCSVSCKEEINSFCKRYDYPLIFSNDTYEFIG